MDQGAATKAFLEERAASRHNMARLSDRRQTKILKWRAEHEKELERRQEKQRRCGAKTRKGTPCQRKGLGRGGRCPNHGGLSTGPKTPEGKARSLQAMREGLARWRAQKEQAEKSRKIRQ